MSPGPRVLSSFPPTFVHNSFRLPWNLSARTAFPKSTNLASSARDSASLKSMLQALPQSPSALSTSVLQNKSTSVITSPPSAVAMVRVVDDTAATSASVDEVSPAGAGAGAAAPASVTPCSAVAGTPACSAASASADAAVTISSPDADALPLPAEPDRVCSSSAAEKSSFSFVATSWNSGGRQTATAASMFSASCSCFTSLTASITCCSLSSSTREMVVGSNEPYSSTCSSTSTASDLLFSASDVENAPCSLPLEWSRFESLALPLPVLNHREDEVDDILLLSRSAFPRSELLRLRLSMAAPPTDADPARFFASFVSFIFGMSSALKSDSVKNVLDSSAAKYLKIRFALPSLCMFSLCWQNSWNLGKSILQMVAVTDAFCSIRIRVCRSSMFWSAKNTFHHDRFRRAVRLLERVRGGPDFSFLLSSAALLGALDGSPWSSPPTACCSTTLHFSSNSSRIFHAVGSISASDKMPPPSTSSSENSFPMSPMKAFNSRHVLKNSCCETFPLPSLSKATRHARGTLPNFRFRKPRNSSFDAAPMSRDWRRSTFAFSSNR
mmetsp:Transcript_9615/g.23617  ORF Transcript_9615/g.23617 Transcript_9615/m.23617 type:complete len:555 (-) Transcript_9615:2547-4211(-)